MKYLNQKLFVSLPKLLQPVSTQKSTFVQNVAARCNDTCRFVSQEMYEKHASIARWTCDLCKLKLHLKRELVWNTKECESFLMSNESNSKCNKLSRRIPISCKPTSPGTCSLKRRRVATLKEGNWEVVGWCISTIHS